jgi:hypothetical protein
VTETPDLPWWGGVYRMNKAGVEAARDDAVRAAERHIRTSARSAGHEPVGRVMIEWTDYDPDNILASKVDGAGLPQVWAATKVQVQPGQAAKNAVIAGLESGNLSLQVDPDQ